MNSVIMNSVVTNSHGFLYMGSFARTDLFAPLEGAVEEIGSRGVGSNPASPHQKSVDLVGENHLLESYMLRAQALDQIHRLRERYVAVVVSVDQ